MSLSKYTVTRQPFPWKEKNYNNKKKTDEKKVRLYIVKLFVPLSLYLFTFHVFMFYCIRGQFSLK